ncbi:uncharacterized protein ARMOST_09571 [Armillaria ostoyae]|uniref:F-box domain-containing protein n=1 Tax=Armillaria ostoyae TaxID=47428 RepID=A0A284RBX4_ARMOS|nr:uncharacterized protein ARMOST_09571 [Armillaria ostoyae]
MPPREENIISFPLAKTTIQTPPSIDLLEDDRPGTPAPIHGLPRETLCEIFLTFAQDPVYSLSVGEWDEPAMIIRQVCQEWHTLLQGRDEEVGSPHSAGSGEVREAPSLYQPPPHGNRYGYPHRSSHHYHCHVESLSGIRNHIPLLENLAIKFLEEPLRIPPVIVFDNAPCLTSIAFTAFYNSPVPSIPFHQLTDFSDTRLSADGQVHHQHLQILEEATALRRFAARYVCVDHAAHIIAKPPLVCQSISHFSACEGALIRSVVLPNVSQIHVDPGWAPYLEDEHVLADLDIVPALVVLLKSSQCQHTLTKLVMEDTYITDNILDIAELTPVLDEWHFTWTDSMQYINSPLQKLVEALAHTETTISGTTTFTILPDLSLLKVSVIDWRNYLPIDFVGEPLANTMEARLGQRGWSGTPFGVWVDGLVGGIHFPRLTYQVATRLRECVAQGHQCELTLSDLHVLEQD